jgi:2-iminobutanoate/2-iminopropanoate deaminase
MEAVKTDTAPAAIGPYSQAIVSEGLVFASGQIPLSPETGEIVAEGITEQTERVMENIKQILAAAGSDFSKVVKTTCFLIDLKDFGHFNDVYGRYFQNTPPARSTVQVGALPRGALVEVEVIAQV